MFLFRIIPGVLWLDVLDRITDQISAFLGGYRFICSILVLMGWMSVLSEIRVRTVDAVKYITVVYYRPHKTQLQRIYAQWQVRLIVCFIMCALSYYFTFEFEDDFPYLAQLKETILNEKYNRDVEEVVNPENDEPFLMAHVYVQRFLQQSESIVWILGTLLRLRRQRFFKVVLLTVMLKPLASILVAWCGNFALWLWLGHVMMRAFDLTPEGHPRMGMAGCYTAVVASTIYWRKYGTREIIVALVAAIGGEVAFQRAVADILEEKKRREQNPGVGRRMWAAVTNLFKTDDDGDSNNVKKPTKGDDNKTGTSGSKDGTAEVTATEIEYTWPSLYSWLAMIVYWAASGIRLDGYDLFTF